MIIVNLLNIFNAQMSSKPFIVWDILYYGNENKAEDTKHFQFISSFDLIILSTTISSALYISS